MFSCPVADVLGNAEVFLVVFYCSLEVSDGEISISEIAIGTSFSGPVANVLGNANGLSRGTLLVFGSRR